MLSETWWFWAFVRQRWYALYLLDLICEGHFLCDPDFLCSHSYRTLLFGFCWMEGLLVHFLIQISQWWKMTSICCRYETIFPNPVVSILRSSYPLDRCMYSCSWFVFKRWQLILAGLFLLSISLLYNRIMLICFLGLLCSWRRRPSTLISSEESRIC